LFGYVKNQYEVASITIQQPSQDLNAAIGTLESYRCFVNIHNNAPDALDGGFLNFTSEEHYPVINCVLCDGSSLKELL
jgi:hypothetical protein